MLLQHVDHRIRHKFLALVSFFKRNEMISCIELQMAASLCSFCTGRTEYIRRAICLMNLDEIPTSGMK